MRRSKVLFLAVVSTVNSFLFFRNSDWNFNRNSSKVHLQNSIVICISNRIILKVLNDVSSANKCQSFLLAKTDGYGILEESKSEKQLTLSIINYNVILHVNLGTYFQACQLF